MEDKNIMLLKHHPIFNLKKDNPFYVNQLGCASDDIEFIDVTSRAVKDKELLKKFPRIALDLSPFYIGPLTSEDGKTCYVFEHYWQASKVYPCFVKDGNVMPEFFDWRAKWFDKKEREELTRHPNVELGYEPGDCVFTLFYENGEWKKLSYVESRKKLYIPAYAKLVYQSETYKKIKELVDSGKKVALLDFDAYNYLNKDYKDGIYKGIDSMKDAINNPRFKCGHAFVLKMLLEGDIEVKDGKVIDNTGILD